jgi:ribonuclease D
VEKEPDVPAMKGWRYDKFGSLAAQLKRGELALRVEGGEVVTVTLAPAEEAAEARVAG